MATRSRAVPGAALTGEPGREVRHSVAEPLRTQYTGSKRTGPKHGALEVVPEPHGPEWELVLRMAASRGFRRSPLLTGFLLFVCRRALTGQAGTINEQQIGVNVFDRSEQFNRSDDNIVRNYARMLRKRIDEYFLGEGVDEPLRMEVPRGGYVPTFFAMGHEPVALASANLVAEESATESIVPIPLSDVASVSRRPWSAVLLLLFGVAIGLSVARLSQSHWFRYEAAADRLSREFWQTIFVNDHDTFIVPSDGGLVILHRFLEQPTNLSDYVSGSYRRPEMIAEGLHELTKTTAASELPLLSHKVEMLGDRRYTSVVDLDLASRISRQHELIPERLFIRFARDLRMDDLKASNAILIGSIDANPWVELFQPQLNFQFSYGGAFGGSATIVNRKPLAGEQLSYSSVTGDPAQRTYGVIASVPNLGGTGHVLIIEGINIAGTQAAGEFLLDPVRMQAILERARKPNGEFRAFEVLLETSSIAANSSQLKILSQRVGPS